MRKDARTAKSLFAEAAKVKKEIESGKLKGKKLQAAKYKYGNLMYRGRKREKAVIAKLKNQPFLPEFLKQMDVVRIEEMVAQKVFDSIRAQISVPIAIQQVKRSRKAS